MDASNEVAERVTLAVHTIAGIAMGYASLFAGSNRLALGYGMVLLFVIGYALQAVFGRKGLGWWAANGLFAYLLVWFVSWVSFYNIIFAG